jgi:hypothetical protein
MTLFVLEFCNSIVSVENLRQGNRMLLISMFCRLGTPICL